MNVKFKKVHPNAVLPTYAHPDGEDNGLDLVAVSIEETEDYIEYDTGVAVEIPKGYCGFLVPNSRCSKKDLVMCNAPGVIDPGYRGTMRARYKNVFHAPTLWQKIAGKLQTYSHGVGKLCVNPRPTHSKAFAVGDVVAQLVIVPAPQIESGWVEELTPSKRDTGGFGSTIKKPEELTPEIELDEESKKRLNDAWKKVWKEDIVKPCPRCGSPMSVSEDLDDTVLLQCEDCGYWKRIDNDGHTTDGGY